ncbi:hypothetical protein BDZ45DRAFT_763935 [Acephala macrosclerotiorum]|nr:hypothetical protein BDZ45DRAFT_763935 [Acephala macrosclerotiorum]
MSSNENQQASSNELSLIFGTLATFLAIMSVLIGIYQYRQLSRTTIGGQDIEMQTTPPPERASSWTSFASIGSNASFEAHLPSTRAIEAPPPTCNDTTTKVQLKIDHARDFSARQN